MAHPDWLATVVESADDANDTAVTSTAAPTTAAARLQKLALKHRRLLAIVPVLGMLAGGAVLFQQTGRAQTNTASRTPTPAPACGAVDWQGTGQMQDLTLDLHET